MSRFEEIRRGVTWVRSPRHAAAAVRSSLKAPLVQRMQEQVAALRTVSLPEFLAEAGIDQLIIPAQSGVRHGWQIGALEQQLLATVAGTTGARTAFEIGTFDGGTTLAMATAMPKGSTVHTIDLPDERFTATQSPAKFGAADVGRAFRTADLSDCAAVVQHRHDTKTFDFSPWYGLVDLVLVDGAHDREHGVADTSTALRLVRPGGWIFWDDFEPYWHGLVDGIITTAGAERLTKIARTSFAYARG